ncbi:peptidoglycan DD-metalloendopeptidase family protein [Streptomyces sp. TRM70308]|uniref:M23 family metallopeptidase n=1 Tax=Streptomyces sp. TRM70308 TaxID=3131932 RepID=UPI003D022632
MNDRPPSGPTATTGTGVSGYAGYEDPYGQAAAYGYATGTHAGYPADEPLLDTWAADSGQPGRHHPFEGSGHPFAEASYAPADDLTAARLGAAYPGAAYDGVPYGGSAYGGSPYGSAYDDAVHPLGGYHVGADEAAGHVADDPGAEGYGTGHGAVAGDGWGADGWSTDGHPLVGGIPAQPGYHWATAAGPDSDGAAGAFPAESEPAHTDPAHADAAHPYAADSPYATGEHHVTVERLAAVQFESHGDPYPRPGTAAPGAEPDTEADGTEADGTGSESTGSDADVPAYSAVDADDVPPSPGSLSPVEPAAATVAATTATAGLPVGRAGRRRAAKPKRSALLTVAVPSVCVMGVAGIAAASVGGDVAESAEDAPAQAAEDAGTAAPVAVNSKLDTQLAGLTDDARDFGERASRTQERIDLKARQEAERKRKAEEAARREALRPKFALPVDQRGLSAYYGQAGINWMSVHTGIDFPVSYGTPVKAATDGTITTKWDIAYGNMAIVTAADGTQTWYCHLSSTKIRSGQVKAGDTIGYAGSSGNSTGPHLHFEVRPGGGTATDPVAWFRSKGLDPT